MGRIGQRSAEVPLTPALSRAGERGHNCSTGHVFTSLRRGRGAHSRHRPRFHLSSPRERGAFPAPAASSPSTSRERGTFPAPGASSPVHIAGEAHSRHRPRLHLSSPWERHIPGIDRVFTSLHRGKGAHSWHRPRLPLSPPRERSSHDLIVTRVRGKAGLCPFLPEPVRPVSLPLDHPPKPHPRSARLPDEQTFAFTPAHELVRMVAAREVSPVELTE